MGTREEKKWRMEIDYSDTTLLNAAGKREKSGWSPGLGLSLHPNSDCGALGNTEKAGSRRFKETAASIAEEGC